ncbi:MAG: ADP-glyceromanno-heptose 6-epimerase [Patescibacteria group bacterium]|nr:ADP-glyceromanno-heptose 6-epimerase [Patescibacteria group bacterium]
MIIVTGGAGFIGSALIWALNQRGQTDILVVDAADHERKSRNLAPLKYRALIAKDEFRKKLSAGAYDPAGVQGIIHEGACSSTTETDWKYLEENNVRYTQGIISWCVRHGVRCVYASSGAVYGDGNRGFGDDPDVFDRLEPLNLYGRSKLLVDCWARDAGHLERVAGLRYFNVFGPNEYHKGAMQSVIAKAYPKLQREGVIELFKSYRSDVPDGEQRRDFIYVNDVVEATLYFFDHPNLNGIYNVGTGVSRTWNDVATAMFAAAKKSKNIRYIEMPADVRAHYQYRTEADIAKLRAAGYTHVFRRLEDSIHEYVTQYLARDRHLGEE